MSTRPVNSHPTLPDNIRSALARYSNSMPTLGSVVTKEIKDRWFYDQYIVRRLRLPVKKNSKLETSYYLTGFRWPFNENFVSLSLDDARLQYVLKIEYKQAGSANFKHDERAHLRTYDHARGYGFDRLFGNDSKDSAAMLPLVATPESLRLIASLQTKEHEDEIAKLETKQKMEERLKKISK